MPAPPITASITAASAADSAFMPPLHTSRMQREIPPHSTQILTNLTTGRIRMDDHSQFAWFDVFCQQFHEIALNMMSLLFGGFLPCSCERTAEQFSTYALCSISQAGIHMFSLRFVHGRVHHKVLHYTKCK